MRANLSLIAVVFLWGVSPIFVVGMRGAVNPSRAASLAVLLAAASSLVYALLFSRNAVKGAFGVSLTMRNLWRPIVCGLLAFYVYPKCYFNALQSDSPIEANVVNYSWPVFAVLGTCFLARKYPSFEDALGVFLGLVGTIVIVLPARLFTSTLDLAPGQYSGSPFLAAFAGACTYGAYTALLSRTKPIGRDGKPLSTTARFLIILSAGAALQLLTNFDVLFEAPGDRELSSVPLFLLAYSTLSMSLGYFCWLYAVGSLSVAVVSTTYYLTPAIGTVFLLAYSGADIHPSLPCGFLLILLGIYFSRVKRSGVSPLVVALLAVLLSWSASNVPILRATSTGDAGPYSGLVALLTAIFAITGGLVLNSVRERYIQSNKLFLRINALLNEISTAAPDDEAVQRAVRRMAMHVADVCARTVVRDDALCSATGHRLVADLRRELARSPGPAVAARSRILGHSLQLQEDYVNWQYQKRHMLLGHEWSVLVALIGALVVASFRIGGVSLDFQVARAVFVGAVVQIGFAIRDYALGCPGRLIDLLEAGQSVFRAQSLYPYFPTVVLREDLLAARLRRRFPSVYTGRNLLFRYDVGPRCWAGWPTVVVLALSAAAATYAMMAQVR